VKRRRKRANPTLVRDAAEAFGIQVLQADERVLSPNDVGRILSVTGEAVKQWIYHHRLPAVKLTNGYWKIRIADLEDFIRSSQVYRYTVMCAIGTGLSGVAGEAVRSLDHECVFGRSLADSLLKLQDVQPSLCVIDVTGWPDGWKLAEQLALKGRRTDIPILLISDRPLNESDTERAMGLGAKGFLCSPFDARALAGEINRILRAMP